MNSSRPRDFLYILFTFSCFNAQPLTYGYVQIHMCLTVADPGFPVGGGVDLVLGAVDPRGGYISKILHVKTKESGPVGGAHARRAHPRSANA